MHVVRLLAPTIQNEDHTRDIDFSPSGIRERREAGYADTCRVLEQKPWEGDYDLSRVSFCMRRRNQL